MVAISGSTLEVVAVEEVVVALEVEVVVVSLGVEISEDEAVVDQDLIQGSTTVMITTITLVEMITTGEEGLTVITDQEVEVEVPVINNKMMVGDHKFDLYIA